MGVAPGRAKRLPTCTTLNAYGLFEVMQNENEALAHRERNEGVFASMLFYRSFCWHLRQRPVEMNKAAECIQQALASIRAEKHPQLFYSRTLTEFYSMWEYLLDAYPNEICRGATDAATVLNKPGIVALLERKYQNSKAQLVSGLQHALGQLHQLQRHYLNGPAGLATLQICRLLLRVGISPSALEIQSRLARICKDLEHEHQQSIDGQCSLCTGVAASCLTLIGQRETAQQAVAWLLTLGWARYCHVNPSYYDAKKNEHALHYAAMVMTALLDFDSSDVQRVVEVFFRNGETNEEGFFTEWVKYANIDSFELHRYILGEFLRYHLCGKRLAAAQTTAIQTCIAKLAEALDRDEQVIASPQKLRYSSRLNLCSLCLGLVLDMKSVREASKEIVATLYRRADFVSREKRLDGDLCELWDSNVDRTCAMIESYFQFLETINFIEEQQGPAVASDLLPVVSKLKRPN